jgi:hypothetical protein
MWTICGPFSSPPQISMWTAWSTWSTCPNANPARDGNASEMGTPACPTPRCGTLARVSHRVKGVVVQPWLCSMTVIPSVTFAYFHRVATTHQAMKDSRSDTITNAQYKYPPPPSSSSSFSSSSSSSSLRLHLRFHPTRGAPCVCGACACAQGELPTQGVLGGCFGLGGLAAQSGASAK